MKYTVLILSLFALTACDVAPIGEPEGRLYDPEYVAQDCTIMKPDTGGAAVTANASIDQIEDSGFFGKPYDRADVAALFNSSPIATAAYVQKVGISLFKIPRVPKTDEEKEAMRRAGQPVEGPLCRLYGFLPLASRFHHQLWYSVSGGKGGLAGLYFEDCDPSRCPKTTVNNPIILVDDSSDRWTLVHEMNHHNFNTQRKKSPDYESHEELRQKVEAYKSVYTASNGADSMKEAIALDLLVKSLYKLLVYSAFEEIANEGLLLKEFSAGRLKNVYSGDAKNAIWYMKYSRDNGMAKITAVEDELNVLAARCVSNESAREQVNATKAFIASVRAKIDGYIAEGEANSANLLSAGLFSLDGENPDHTDITAFARHLDAHYPELNELTAF